MGEGVFIGVLSGLLSVFLSVIVRFVRGWFVTIRLSPSQVWIARMCVTNAKERSALMATSVGETLCLVLLPLGSQARVPRALKRGYPNPLESQTWT